MLPEAEVEGGGEEGLGEAKRFTDRSLLSLFSTYVASNRPLQRDGSLGPNLLGKLSPIRQHPTQAWEYPGVLGPQSLSQIDSHLSPLRVQAKISSRPAIAIDPLGHRQGVAGCSHSPDHPQAASPGYAKDLRGSWELRRSLGGAQRVSSPLMIQQQ